MEKAPQLLVTGWVVGGIHCPVVLPEELLIAPIPSQPASGDKSD
jgi:hypothetical protein